ncbi:LysR family transcriptional regulator, glycine cleavage system transcriptional activator [Paraburkholderia fungorum]|uniref:LysR family transcriptional regulator, glycine cleavage system transcriptional activator n=1 Tax=Paraburkholderia fungorum TaxID=134537 RepID=A0A1H0ZKN9_9BURK|nr:LysR substrate-binding domain-containing protein [Paraburkholderia fungorum]SDQ28013.1 LysR family transcriptional regulator, glycine cleavage system transcriptional activator [Paraburkholderia fungorum]
MKPIPPLTALRCFEAVARLGGVTPAARELHVTHSAVSQQIKVLEDVMGVVLFIREARGLRLTEEGRLYALDIRAALRDITQATRRAQARPHESELVISTLPSFAQHWLVPRLASFRDAHPYYRVRLLTSLQIEDFRQGVSDIGIRMGQGHWPDVAQQKLFDDDMVVVAAPHFALGPNGRLPVTAGDVLACPLISSPDAPWADWCRAAQVAEPAAQSVVLSANDSNIVIGAVRAGQGVALERRSLVAHALAQRELVQITDICVPYPYPYWLVWRQREILDARQAHFAQWIEGQVDAYLRGGGALPAHPATLRTA